ncbi:hypothetical protein ACSBR2_034831 [Camellia fascicularis]
MPQTSETTHHNNTNPLKPFFHSILCSIEIFLFASISLFSYITFLNPSTPFEPNPTTFTHDNHHRHYSKPWWKPNITRGFVWLDENPSDNNLTWLDTSPPYRVSSDTSMFKYTSWYGSQFVVRIVKESFKLGLENVRWFVMGDDDTMFFTENLVRCAGEV